MDAIADRLAAALGPGAERRETHGSWVVLAGDRAYKVKKPVVLDFLDYGTLERRRAMCREEVAVNRRAAPDVYLGVRAIVPDGKGVALAEEDAPGALDYAVEMRRFDEARTLAAAVARGEASPERVAEAGVQLAAFHAGCERVPGGAEPLQRVMDDNFASLGTLAEDAATRLTRSERFASAFLAARRAELDRRGALDGHGDLRAEHVLLGERIELVDAIEFDPQLRHVDAGMDLAFAVMDLHAAARPDLAAALLAGYRRAGGDPGDDALVAFFASYRAQVRAKVELVRDRPGEATALLALADRLAWRARGPLVVAVAGAAATGKTTLAAALAEASGFEHLSSDVVRKRLAGLQESERAPQGAYSQETTAATYRTLGRLAARCDVAVVDATFRARRDRDGFREALGAREPLFVECRVPAEVAERRAAERLADPGRVSDATPEIARRQRVEFEPLDEIAACDHVTVRADQPPDALVAEVADALDRRLMPAARPQP